MKSPTARGFVWVLAIVVSLVAGWVSLYLAELHYRAPGAGLLTGMCTMSATSNCQKVSQSRWAWLPPLPEPEADDADRPDSKAGAATSKPAGSPDEQGKKASADQPGENTVDRLLAADKKQAKEKADKEAWYRVPVAQLGLAYFTFVFWWLLLTGPSQATRRWTHQVLVVLALLGLAASVCFEIIMWTQLENWCPLCVATHAASLLIAIFVWLLRPGTSVGQSAKASPAPLPVGPTPTPGDSGEGLFGPAPVPSGVIPDATSWPTARVIATTLVVVVLSLLAQREYLDALNQRTQGATSKFYSEYYRKRWFKYERSYIQNYISWATTPKVSIPLEGRPMKGSPKAPRTLVIFSDFECPHCAKFEAFYREKVMPFAQQAAEGGFKVYFKHWPLCKDCNSRMEGDTKHPLACKASYAAEAARLLGGDEAFWKMHDLLFQNQKEWTKTKDFLPYAEQLGLDKDKFVAAMNSSEAISRVRADADDGIDLGKAEIPDAAKRADILVNSTPVVFVDGRRFDSQGNPQTWNMMLGRQDAFRGLVEIMQRSAIPNPAATRPARSPSGGTGGLGPRIPASAPGQAPR